MKIRMLPRIWKLLSAAVSERSPFTLMQLATVDESSMPKLRTIVARDFIEATQTIAFTADIRSRKIAEIRSNPNVALTALDSNKGLQLRMEGRADLVRSTAKKKEAWNRMRAHSHLLFRSPIAPGTVLSSPLDATPDVGCGQESGEPVEHFALVHVTIERMDWLDISSEPHQRCRFAQTENGWSGDWIAP